MSTPALAARIAEYPRPSHFLVHLSDTHLITGDGLLYDAVDADAHLRRIFDEFEQAGRATGSHRLHRRPRRQGRPGGLRQAAFDRRAGRRNGSAPSSSGCMGNHDNRAAFRSELLDLRPVDGGDRPCPRRQRPAGDRPRLDGARRPLRRGHGRPAGLARGGARHPRAARHDPRHAPSAGPERARPRRLGRAARPGLARRGRSRARMCAASSPDTSTTRRTRPSRASRSRSPRRPATRRTSTCRSAEPAAATARRRSTSCTCTDRRCCTRSCRSGTIRPCRTSRPRSRPNCCVARRSRSRRRSRPRRRRTRPITSPSEPPTTPIGILAGV